MDDIATIPTWHRGPGVLVGDAANATSPNAGQGASLAMEDALVLAKCLRDLPDTGQAPAADELLRRQRAEQVVAGRGCGLGRRARHPSQMPVAAVSRA